MATNANPTFRVQYGPVLGVGHWAFVCAMQTPVNGIGGGIGCGPQWSVPPGGVVVQFSGGGLPTLDNPTPPPDALQLGDGFQGQDWIEVETKSVWIVFPPAQNPPGFELGQSTIEADYGSGDTAAARAQVRALVESLHFGNQGETPSATLSLSTATPASPSTSGTPLPRGGVARDRAIEIAQGFTVLTTVTSAEAGRVGDLNTDPNFFPSGIGKPDRLIWRVTLKSNVTVCSGALPLSGGSCSTPVTSIFLDYHTGDWLFTAS